MRKEIQLLQMITQLAINKPEAVKKPAAEHRMSEVVLNTVCVQLDTL